MAGHYRFEPRPVAPARGNEKGRVERAIRYIRDSFFAGRTFTDLDDLNAQARAWCLGTAADRRWPQDGALSVRQAFEAEREKLLALRTCASTSTTTPCPTPMCGAPWQCWPTS
jgi:hypothetical protein